MKSDAWIRQLEKVFKEHADPAYAEKQSAYLLNQFPFLGIAKPKRAELQKPLLNSYRQIEREELIETVKELWSKPEREFHYAAIDLLVRHWKRLELADLGLLEDLMRTHAWWDSVDTLSASVLGRFLLENQTILSEMDKWIEDEFLWIRRAAIIFQLKWKKHTQEERLFSYCRQRMHESNFFIRKGIGWALREYSKTAPESVSQFLSQHASELSKLSYKEAGRLLVKDS